MTTKEASKEFKLDVAEIRKRYHDGMILGATKIGKYINIPDDTKIIPAKLEIQCFLFQILKYKNNPATVLSMDICPDLQKLCILYDYLYRQGYIGKCDDFNDINDFFKKVKITDKGLNFIINKKQKINIANNFNLFFNLNFINIG